ncbi:MAG: sigma-70 family RNA polymerase sigma factor [Planctomycetes bacterium]|nr:sigma-70 family RNA polymerase sigma factor [Planctomycetota bacterium]
MTLSPRSSGASESTSSSLLSRVKGRDPDAWARLAKLYGPLVYRWARQSGLQATDAADVVQDVFLNLARDISGFRRDRPNDSFRKWLRVITRNRVYDRFRNLAAEPQAAGGSDANKKLRELPTFPPDADDGSDFVEIRRLRSRALELLRGEFKASTWQAFWRAAVEGDAPADVAEDLGLSVWAVYKARSRVLRRLNQELSGLHG